MLYLALFMASVLEIEERSIENGGKKYIVGLRFPKAFLSKSSTILK